ncbi:MAG TPA: L,D-transpeptidase, partial [Pilimelia sp.]|nr:L,D-transpeptidase [Pilimelia sp.]
MSDQAEREQDSSPADQVPPPGADASTSPGGLPGASALTESDRTGYRRWWRWAAGATAVAAAAAGTALYASAEEPVPVTAPAAPAVAPSASAGAEPVPSAARPPKGLPAVAYLTRVPAGLPADPAPMASALLTTVVRPQRTLAVFDRPGGRARILLPEEIHGVPVHVPLVRRRTGWVAVLLPSANRTVGWLPPGGWDTVTVRDQVVIRRKAHTLTWLRDGRVRGKWTVSVGSAASPTPLGRTFVFGRSTLGDPV